ncbi:16824_t:CDS:2, partial [Funneliformis geosporum]
SSIRSELNGENPILAIHPSANSYVSFSSLITSPYVVKNEVGNGYFKPLDIVQIKQFERKFGVRFYHVGIYLGDVGNAKIELVNCIDITQRYLLRTQREWPSKLLDPLKLNFKKIDMIYGIETVEDNKTELAASVGVPGAIVAGGFTGAGLWGVIGSIALVPATGGASLLLGATSVGAAGAVVATTLNVADGYAEINNGKGSTIKLINEMNESNNKLGERSNKLADDIKANIEVPPKEHCRIM